MIPEIFCSVCVHIHQTRKENRICCNAYPDGIPDEIFWASKLHNEILLDQEGDYIFTNKEGREYFIPKLASTNVMPSLSLKEILKKMRDEREKNNQ
jgi:hypothetical protein